MKRRTVTPQGKIAATRLTAGKPSAQVPKTRVSLTQGTSLPAGRQVNQKAKLLDEGLPDEEHAARAAPARAEVPAVEVELAVVRAEAERVPGPPGVGGAVVARGLAVHGEIVGVGDESDARGDRVGEDEPFRHELDRLDVRRDGISLQDRRREVERRDRPDGHGTVELVDPALRHDADLPREVSLAVVHERALRVLPPVGARHGGQDLLLERGAVIADHELGHDDRVARGEEDVLRPCVLLDLRAELRPRLHALLRRDYEREPITEREARAADAVGAVVERRHGGRGDGVTEVRVDVLALEPLRGDEATVRRAVERRHDVLHREPDLPRAPAPPVLLALAEHRPETELVGLHLLTRRNGHQTFQGVLHYRSLSLSRRVARKAVCPAPGPRSQPPN